MRICIYKYYITNFKHSKYYRLQDFNLKQILRILFKEKKCISIAVSINEFPQSFLSHS